jgi:site-specific recombinase XerD
VCRALASVPASTGQAVKNCGDNVFEGIAVKADEASFFHRFLADNDFAADTRRAFAQDIRKFARWFSFSNKEPFAICRVTIRDISDFRDHLRREKSQAVSTVNRCLVTIRRFFGWLVEQGIASINPAKKVKELRRQPLAPKGLDRSQVRRLLREIELRQDIRANAIFSLMLYTGCRVSDLINLELSDLLIGDRSGSVVFRFGKGNKQRTVPIPLSARQAIQTYLDTRPPVVSNSVFIGERGSLSVRGIRALCDKYSAITGIKLHPHLFRHTMAKQFLADNGNDLVSLAQILGHESLNTTSRYSQKNEEQLGESAERLSY